MSAYEPYEGTCSEAGCNGRICLTAEQHRDTWENGRTFYCSQGHPRIWTKTQKRTYQQLERQVADLQQENRTLRDDFRWEDRAHQADLTEFATCPWPGCHRAGYRYATQRTLLDHLDRTHGTDVGIRISWALAETEENVAS